MGRKRNFKGGSAFVGKPYNISAYPSVGNYYAVNPWKNDLYTGNIINEKDFSIFPNKYMKGGYIYKKTRGRTSKKFRSRSSSKRRKSTRKMRGGLGPLLSDAVTGSRVVGNGISNIYNTMSGVPTNVSPLPYKDQLVSSQRNYLG
jgi:hypothetical protein